MARQSSSKKHQHHDYMKLCLQPCHVLQRLSKEVSLLGPGMLCISAGLQVYNENIRDLLHPEGDYLDIREDPVKGMCVAGISEVIVVHSLLGVWGGGGGKPPDGELGSHPPHPAPKRRLPLGWEEVLL